MLAQVSHMPANPGAVSASEPSQRDWRGGRARLCPVQLWLVTKSARAESIYVFSAFTGLFTICDRRQVLTSAGVARPGLNDEFASPFLSLGPGQAVSVDANPPQLLRGANRGKL